MHKDLWRAIVECDPCYDGRYYYGVVSTGIFCKPSCRSRTPRPENVKIFHSLEEGVQTGFRYCKRCRPDLSEWKGVGEESVEQVIRLIDDRYEEDLSLESLAKTVYLSPYHLHHLFKRSTGNTPADYLQQRRIEVATQLLAKEDCPIALIAERVGFRSAAHFATVFRKVTGIQPSAYRQQALEAYLLVGTAI